VFKDSAPSVSSITRVSVLRPEAAQVGGAARRLDAGPRRQDDAPQEDGVQQEEDVRQQEEEVDVPFFIPVRPPKPRGPSLGRRRAPPTRWTGSKLGTHKKKTGSAKPKTLIPDVVRDFRLTFYDVVFSPFALMVYLSEVVIKYLQKSWKN